MERYCKFPDLDLDPIPVVMNAKLAIARPVGLHDDKSRILVPYRGFSGSANLVV